MDIVCILHYHALTCPLLCTLQEVSAPLLCTLQLVHATRSLTLFLWPYLSVTQRSSDSEYLSLISFLSLSSLVCCSTLCRKWVLLTCKFSMSSVVHCPMLSRKWVSLDRVLVCSPSVFSLVCHSMLSRQWVPLIKLALFLCPHLSNALLSPVGEYPLLAHSLSFHVLTYPKGFNIMCEFNCKTHIVLAVLALRLQMQHPMMRLIRFPNQAWDRQAKHSCEMDKHSILCTLTYSGFSHASSTHPVPTQRALSRNGYKYIGWKLPFVLSHKWMN
jgi:hypothetical protein